MKNIVKISFISLLFLFFAQIDAAANLVMISPAGDLNNPGRKLSDGYERGVAFQIAEKLKNLLFEKYGIKAVLTREPREAIVPLQNASYANRFNADFFLSIHVFKQENPKPKVFTYYQMFNRVKDLAGFNVNSLEFVSIYESHYKNLKLTMSLAERMKNALIDTKFDKIFDSFGPIGLPLKPLVGITTPAMVLEIGLCEENDWKNIVEPIAESLSFLKE